MIFIIKVRFALKLDEQLLVFMIVLKVNKRDLVRVGIE